MPNQVIFEKLEHNASLDGLSFSSKGTDDVGLNKKLGAWENFYNFNRLMVHLMEEHLTRHQNAL